jgi:hypothetical protein
MSLSNAERQARHRERVKEALRNARTAPTPAPGRPAQPPLRLLKITADGYGLVDGDDYTDLEICADEVLGLLCPQPARGFPPYTKPTDTLIEMIERDPAGFIDYTRRYVADWVAAYEAKPKKRRRSVT